MHLVLATNSAYVLETGTESMESGKLMGITVIFDVEMLFYVLDNARVSSNISFYRTNFFSVNNSMIFPPFDYHFML
jgi:hypothetical protein